MKLLLVITGALLINAGYATAGRVALHNVELCDKTTTQSTTKTFAFKVGNLPYGASPELQAIRLRFDRRSQSMSNCRYNRTHWQLRKIAMNDTNLIWESDEYYPSDTYYGSIPSHWETREWSGLGLIYGDELELSVTVANGDYYNAVVEIRVESEWLVSDLLESADHSLQFGVNRCGAEFGNARNGLEGVDYEFPSPELSTYFNSFNLKLFRIPMLWERVLSENDGSLNEDYLQGFDKIAAEVERIGGSLVLDIHNYGRRDGFIIGSPEVSIELFAYTWRLLAERYKNRPIWLSLNNEFHDMPGETVVAAQNAALQAIRETGATNRVVVSGNMWSGAHSWFDSSSYSAPNSELLLQIVDPLSNTVVAVHMYADTDASGTSPTVVSETIGSERLRQVTEWARATGSRLYLEEFGFATNMSAIAAMKDTLNFVSSNKTVFVGATYWAAGPRWGDYMFSIEPPKDTYRTAPQLAVLSSYTDMPQQPLTASLVGGKFSFETNVIRETASVSWHKGNGVYPGYYDKDQHTLTVYATRGAQLSSVVFANGSTWNRITELSLAAVFSDGSEQALYHSRDIPYGEGCRIEFPAVEGVTALRVTLYDSYNRASFSVTGLIESESMPAIRVFPAAGARYGDLTRVFASDDLATWCEIDSYLYGVKTFTQYPIQTAPKKFFRIMQEGASASE